MSAPEALAVTGFVLLFVAAVVAAYADDLYTRRPVVAGMGWLAFAAAMSCFVGAAWWETLA